MAFAFDAVAHPCDARADALAETSDVTVEAMPCHEMMMTADIAEHQPTPEHLEDSCCCAALLTTVIGLERSELRQPLPGILAWSVPLNDRVENRPFEYEPPPPRA